MSANTKTLSAMTMATTNLIVSVICMLHTHQDGVSWKEDNWVYRDTRLRHGYKYFNLSQAETTCNMFHRAQWLWVKHTQ